jgi:hypothetical protein
MLASQAEIGLGPKQMTPRRGNLFSQSRNSGWGCRDFDPIAICIIKKSTMRRD